MGEEGVDQVVGEEMLVASTPTLQQQRFISTCPPSQPGKSQLTSHRPSSHQAASSLTPRSSSSARPSNQTSSRTSY